LQISLGAVKKEKGCWAGAERGKSMSGGTVSQLQGPEWVVELLGGSRGCHGGFEWEGV